MPPRKVAEVMPDNFDPVDEVIREDRFTTATELSDAIESLSGYSTGTIKGVLFKVPKGGGKYETIETVFPPFDSDKIIEDLKERFGGGDYLLRIMEIGKPGVRKNIPFSIAQERVSLTHKSEDKTDLIALMMQQANASKSDMMTMMMALNTANQQSSDRMMQMMTVLLPAMMGNQTKMGDMLPLIAAMKSDAPPPTSLKDTLETFAAIKGIVGGDAEKSEGFNPDDIAGSLVRFAGPVAGALGRAFSGARNGQAAPVQEAIQYAEENPAPAPTFGAPRAVPPALEAPAHHNRVIALVREDVLYFFGRGHDPDLAAEAILAIIDRSGLGEDELNAALAPLVLAPDPLAAFASEGLDLRANPQWAEDFRTAIIAAYFGDAAPALPGGDIERADRNGGGDSDPGGNVEAGA